MTLGKTTKSLFERARDLQFTTKFADLPRKKRREYMRELVRGQQVKKENNG